MSEPDAGDFGKRNSVRLLYKIIGYVAIWIVALLLTAPGLWPLAWMFPRSDLSQSSIVMLPTPAAGE